MYGNGYLRVQGLAVASNSALKMCARRVSDLIRLNQTGAVYGAGIAPEKET